jgi:hypothetical protein
MKIHTQRALAGVWMNLVIDLQEFSSFSTLGASQRHLPRQKPVKHTFRGAQKQRAVLAHRLELCAVC